MNFDNCPTNQEYLGEFIKEQSRKKQLMMEKVMEKAMENQQILHEEILPEENLIANLKTKLKAKEEEVEKLKKLIMKHEKKLLNARKKANDYSKVNLAHKEIYKE